MAQTLEINVFDEIKISDDLKNTIVIILEAFKAWFNSDDNRPFSLTVKKLQNKAPPTLEIYVHDDIKVKQAFGTK